MKKQTKSNQQKQFLFAAIAAVIFMFAAGSQSFGQKFKPGDKVECDPTGTGTYLKGTILEYLENDNPIFKGEYYLTRVRIDKWTLYPEGVLCPTERVRLAKTAAPAPPKQTPKEENENQPNETKPAAEPGAKFKPGDRVECDTMNIGKWFKGTVFPFEEKDNP